MLTDIDMRMHHYHSVYHMSMSKQSNAADVHYKYKWKEKSEECYMPSFFYHRYIMPGRLLSSCKITKTSYTAQMSNSFNTIAS